MCGVECLGWLLLVAMLVLEIEHFLVDGEVAISVCLVLTGLTEGFAIWFVRDWALLHHLDLVLAPSLERIIIEKGRFMLARVYKALSIRCKRLLVWWIKHWSILHRLWLWINEVLIEILWSYCDLRFIRTWWWIIRLEDHCWIKVDEVWGRSVFAYEDARSLLSKALLYLCGARVFEG